MTAARVPANRGGLYTTGRRDGGGSGRPSDEAEVVVQDVEEAIPLMDQSKAWLREEGRQQSTASTEPMLTIYKLLRGMCIRLESTWLPYSDVRRGAEAQGITNEQLDKCLRTYERLDTLMVAGDGDMIKVIG